MGSHVSWWTNDELGMTEGLVVSQIFLRDECRDRIWG